MDTNLMEYVTKATSALKGDANLLSAFTGNPVKIIEQILGVDLPDDIINQVVKLVQQQLSGEEDSVKETAEKSSGLLGGAIDALKKIF